MPPIRHSYSLGQLTHKTKLMMTIDTALKIIHGSIMLRHRVSNTSDYGTYVHMYMSAFWLLVGCKSTVVVDLSSQGPSYDLKGF